MKINAQCEAWLGQLNESPVFKKKLLWSPSWAGLWLCTSDERGGEFSEQERKSNCVSDVRGGF